MAHSRDSLRRRTWIAVLWSGFGNYGSSAVRLVSILALGWLLPPSDFGLLALALMVLVFAEGVGEMGLAWAVVQQREVAKGDLDSMFWCSLAVNALLAAATVFWAAPITAFLGDPGAAPVLRLVAPVLVINALSHVPRAVLLRRIDFRRVSLAQLYGEAAFGAVGLTLAALGFGAFSLGGAVLAHRGLVSLLYFTGTDWRPGPKIDVAALRRLLRCGSQVMAGSVLDRVLLNLDYFVIGRFMGTQALGYYSLAFQLALLPLERLVGSAHRVVFPSFSLLQDDLERLRSGLLAGLRHLFAATLPVALSIAILGPWLLRGVYGDRWAPSIPALRILGLAGLFFVPKLFEAALLAVGRPQIRVRLSLLRLVVFTILAWAFGARLGIAGIAACVGLALAAWGGANLVIGVRILHIRWRQVGASLWPATRAGLAALSPLALFHFVPLAEHSPWAALAYAGTAMGLIYLALLAPAYKTSLRERRPRWQP